jgi:hypothetical protein
LLPDQLPITYPYEWCFDQLKDAALACIAILRMSIDHGMILKDATRLIFKFNMASRCLWIPFLLRDMILQSHGLLTGNFANHFYFPADQSLHATGWPKIIINISEGIPVNMAASMLPARSRFKLSVWLHVYLQNKSAGGIIPLTRNIVFSREKLVRLIDHLQSTIAGLKFNDAMKSDWNNYYGENFRRRLSRFQRKDLPGISPRVRIQTALDLEPTKGFSPDFGGESFHGDCLRQ